MSIGFIGTVRGIGDALGTGFNVASMLLGCALGAFFAGSMADKFGRKPLLVGTAIAFIDRIGRKPLLQIGALGQAATLGAMALIFATGDLSADGQLQLKETRGFWALLAANAYVAFFATAWGPVMWVMLGELWSGATIKWSRLLMNVLSLKTVFPSLSILATRWQKSDVDGRFAWVPPAGRAAEDTACAVTGS